MKTCLLIAQSIQSMCCTDPWFAKICCLISSVQSHFAFNFSTNAFTIIVNFPDTVSLAYTFEKYVSTQLDVPAIFEIVAVGAIAINKIFLLGTYE